jgi:hypothetical protein
MNINELLDRFEILYPMNERIELLRRAYVDQDLSSIFKLASPSEELRKAVMEENMHSIFRLIAEQNTNTVPIEDLRKAVVEDNLHSIFRILADVKLKDGSIEDLRKAVIENNLHSIFRLVEVDEDLRKAMVEKNLHSIFRLVEVDEDLRKAIVEKNIHSLFRILDIDEDVKKILLNDNIWSLWKILDTEVSTNFVSALKHFASNDILIDDDCFSRGQLQSKLWLINKLDRLNLDLGTVFLCAGWYSTLATMMFEKELNIEKIRSFDIDPSCVDIAERFNKPWVMEGWKFKATTKDILSIDYIKDRYTVAKSDGTTEQLSDSPNTVINTSCEHIENFSTWYNKIPKGTLIVLQTNDYFEIKDHVNCSVDLTAFEAQTPMTECLYEGALELPKYTRYMRIGYR